jgi:hypothetical protein
MAGISPARTHEGQTNACPRNLDAAPAQPRRDIAAFAKRPPCSRNASLEIWRAYPKNSRREPLVDRPPYRADHVGSYLRPQRLIAARDAFFAGKLEAEALRAVEDACIVEVVRAQENVGLRGVTDGEFRRTYFHVDFLEKLEGVTVSYG